MEQFTEHSHTNNQNTERIIMDKEIELVIFDCDGTLVDSEPITTRVIVNMIKEYGFHLQEDESRSLFTGTNMKNILDFLENKGMFVNHHLFEEKYRSESEMLFKEELQPIQGAHGLMDWLQLPKCIASNGPQRKMKVTLEASGLKRFFPDEHIFSAYDIQKWKPEPDLFIHAARTCNAESKNCLVVEDTIHGIMAAKEAQMKVIGVNVRDQIQDVKDLNVMCFENLKEVKDYLQTIL